MSIKDAIIEYNFDGKMEHIYKKYAPRDVIKTILEILENTLPESTLNRDMFFPAMAFITDTIILSDLSDKDKKAFIETLYELNYFDEIEKYLYNDYLYIKSTTIYSIGKISIKDNVKYLEKAFEKYYNQNPIICSKLLLEIKWLGSKNYKHYCSMLKKDKDIISSIALCIHLDSCSDDIELTKTFNIFKSKFKDIFENKIIEACDYLFSYTFMIQNIQNTLIQKDWEKEIYINSILY
jgi:hypothetical protein